MTAACRVWRRLGRKIRATEQRCTFTRSVQAMLRSLCLFICILPGEVPFVLVSFVCLEKSTFPPPSSMDMCLCSGSTN
ncbi:hypothetical protein XELAEV_18014621mg [Xenopus laevis]|uniref:Uncharacterized protein n=1 Tax=Xenopus laevis TaxID=8355 RepID=A0A974HV46_XENLA|nr:hypothetical protein XELAEV_18014621mg [Xenopus laevis]